MKFTSAIVFASVITSALALPASLLKQARRLDQNQEQQQDEYTFLQGYSLKMLRCKAGETYISPVDGSYEYSSVVFRLCPSECDDSTFGGCKEGYGDYVVGLNTFTAAYLQAKREEMENNNEDGNNGNWKMEELGACQEYEADKDAEIADDVVFYVGPACSDDDSSIGIDMYLDATCQTRSTEYTFEQISNGVSLPYSSGGLVADNCESCYGENDRGEFELSEMCTSLYQYSGKCETNMAEGTYHYMGKKEEACDTIRAMLPMSAKKGGKAGKVIGWVVFALVVVGVAGYAYTQHKKKQDDKRAGLMA